MTASLQTVHILTWVIIAAATAGVIIRPFKWPEAIWACAGALLLLGLGLLSVPTVLHAVGKGGDVYLFLTGMMLLSEAARREGLFDWLAAMAVAHAQGSQTRLFVLIFGVGTVVTAFLSNDATAVVLTPAVYAAARSARVKPLPYLFICAFVANAASFILPISNPANIVLYGDRTPPLGQWLASFALPSCLAVAATFLALWWVVHKDLKSACASDIAIAPLELGAKVTLVGLAVTTIVLMGLSLFSLPLGGATCALGAATAGLTLLFKREPPWRLVGAVSWSVLPLVAGLFVLVEGLQATGVISVLAYHVQSGAAVKPNFTAAGAGSILAIACNLMNNLPAGLVAATAIQMAHLPPRVVDALLIGVDLGPNLSITGSLATILWLQVIRREGEEVGFFRFLKVGLVVMPPALILALLARLILPW